MNKSTGDSKQPSYYDREILYREVWEEPMIHVAKRYRVLDVALMKTCKKLRIPEPGLGYWAKKAYGDETEKPQLPDFPDPPKILRRTARPPVEAEEKSVEERLAPEAFEQAAQLTQREDSLEMEIHVPENLDGTHPFVRNTSRDLLSRAKTRYYVMDYGRIESFGADTFKVVVSPDSVDRALKILQAMCDAFNLRNIDVL